MAKIPTVRVTLKASGDSIVINQDRFDPELHKLESKADAAVVQKAKAEKAAEAEAERELTNQRERNAAVTKARKGAAKAD